MLGQATTAGGLCYYGGGFLFPFLSNRQKIIFSQKNMAKINMYSGKSLGSGRYQNSPVMKKLLANPKIAGALDKPRERAEFFRDLQSAGNGGVTKNDVKEMLGKYMMGNGRTITRRKAAIIAGEMFQGDSRKYILPKNNPSANGVSAANQSANFSAAQTPVSIPRTVSTTGGIITSGLLARMAGERKAIQSSKNLSEEENKRDRGSFSRALAAVRRNKRN